MRVHLYSTDVSAFKLPFGRCGIELTAIVVPENRVTSSKVATLRARASAPVLVQKRGEGLSPKAPRADAAIVWLYSQIFPVPLIKAYPAGMLNMHGGRIPEYRGASVLQWAIINGERTLGVTWHQIVEEVDAGPIWAETEIPIHSDDMASTVRERMISAGHELFHSAWSALTEGALPVRVPDLSKGRIWPQRKDADGLVPPGLPEKRVRDLVRALSPPWPGASIMAPSGLRRIERLGGPEDENALRYETADGRILFLCLSDHP